MQVHKSQLTDTSIKLILEADQELLDDIKRQVLSQLKRDVKVAGFRSGKVPLEMVEKHVDPAALQSKFIDAAINRMYSTALAEQNIRPVAQPEVNIKKFVPFTTLEFEATVEAIGKVTLADYKRIMLAKKPIKVSDKDVQEVINNLKLRLAEKVEVQRAAQDKDEIWIDFTGRDAVTDAPIQGGDGQDYPLALGSNTFIPGFETNLVGAKPGEEREFTLDFPVDYGVKALKGKKVTFKVTVKKVSQVDLPKEDDIFAAKAGPFKSLSDLKTDIQKQLTSEREYQNDRDYESDLLAMVTEQSTVAVPAPLVDEELDRLEREELQNVTYRGQTWEEHLTQEGVTAEEHKANNRPSAELRVKAGLVLAEIAETEQVEVTPEEFETRLKSLRAQYTDPKMQAELDKPENRRELASRLLSEKTISILVSHVTAGKSEKPVNKKLAK